MSRRTRADPGRSQRETSPAEPEPRFIRVLSEKVVSRSTFQAAFFEREGFRLSVPIMTVVVEPANLLDSGAR